MHYLSNNNSIGNNQIIFALRFFLLLGSISITACNLKLLLKVEVITQCLKAFSFWKQAIKFCHGLTHQRSSYLHLQCFFGGNTYFLLGDFVIVIFDKMGHCGAQYTRNCVSFFVISSSFMAFLPSFLPTRTKFQASQIWSCPLRQPFLFYDAATQFSIYTIRLWITGLS